ncbi:MAG TPA: GDSL-type esterase/lipase family protein [Candidatus Cloacimonas sp.]|nr:GDSL-type esterase/lipase family protein [Candidatus Cloacimonas sp.]HPN26346.1 GDSL-type esterase/lipase family protein [Candidatus Cloacimonas sp.]
MSKRFFLSVLILALAFLMLQNNSRAEDNITVDNTTELFTEEEYPSDMDTLEEFIQSYYLLLESNEYLKQFKFINPEKNYISGDKKALQSFYEKLLELRSGLRDRVTIYQIGDSHIQSGYFSGTARTSLQKYFGNSGRGLIFPLRLAGTNQPDDYRITASGAFSRSNSERGLSGYALNATNGMCLEITTNNFFKGDNSFNTVSMITAMPGLKPKIDLAEKNIKEYSIKAGNYFYSRVSWDKAVTKIKLTLAGEPSTLFGISLENNQPGLLYHSCGINGAGFYNLTAQSTLFEQIGLLNPDLIIISLGTNDAQGTYRNEVFSKNLISFMDKLKQYNPETPVLFTLPPDSYKRGKHNSDLDKVEKVIIDYAKENHYAWWNLSIVMGGNNSVQKWRNQQMAANDMLHYTPKGYMLQGYLFYQAFIKSYKSFSEKAG